MPLPTSTYVAQMIKGQLTVVGAPGTVVGGDTPFNPLHRMVDIMCEACWPAVLASFSASTFIGSLGGPSGVAQPPLPQPLITMAQMQADVLIRIPLTPTVAGGLAAQNLWTGPFGTSLSLGVGMGVLMALNSSPFSIALAGVDPVFTNLTGGFVELLRPPIEPASLVGSVLAGWSSDPLLGPGERLLMANAMVGAFTATVNSIQLACGIVNVTPPAVVIVPGVPYPQSLPLVIS